ncbi:MAG: glycosyltransferase family 2 protein [Isosphaeraceae bacterium]
MSRQWIFHTPHLSIPRLCIILPVHNEQANLPVLYRRLTDVLSQSTASWNLIFVDDGSRDGGPEWLSAAAKVDPKVTVVTLSRNFGHQAAVTIGLELLGGRDDYDAAIIMDTDLQDPPELIPGLVLKWHEGNEIVHAVRQNRQETQAKKLAYWAFYRIYRALADVDVPLDSGDFSLISADAVQAIIRLPEKNRFHRGLRAFVGFRQATVAYDRPARFAGSSKYNFVKLVRLALEGLVSFSSLPLRLVSLMGIMTLISSIFLLMWVLMDAFSAQTAPRGWASLTGIVLFIGSVQMIALGIIGEYLRQIFLETKRRPAAIISSIQGYQYHKNTGEMPKSKCNDDSGYLKTGTDFDLIQMKLSK